MIPGPQKSEGRLLARADRGRQRQARGRVRRSDRRRVRLRPHRPRVARSAGVDPRIRRHRDRARRRRQRREQRRQPRRRGAAGVAGRPRRTGPPPVQGAAAHCRARGLEPAGRLSHAGQDPHPRRRHSLGEAAGGAHRSLYRASRSPTRSAHAGRARGHDSAITDADAVLVSDYGSGLVTPRFVAELAARCARASAACRS